MNSTTNHFLQVRAVDEVRRAKDVIAVGDRLTNFYVGDAALETWIRRKQLLINSDAQTLLMLRERNGFRHLYFVSTDLNDLADKLSALIAQSKGIISTDLIGDCSEVSTAFNRAGFERYVTLTRMFKLKSIEKATVAEDDWFAAPNETNAVEEIIYENMDPLCEQIPDSEDIQVAVEHQQVLAARHGSELAAILYFDRHGVTATLRFWAGRKKFRGLGYGKTVYDRYIALNADARRLILWVRDDNVKVKQIYLSDGMSLDSLHDEVWLWKGMV
ncbi:MAG: hypothetical protein IJ668_04785 [Selenomonadaceae bacterium]|nr:hypothetical protein [Selenomonadaceae bacterium]